LAKILIVDDDTTILRFLESVFATAGHEVVPIRESPRVMGYLEREDVDAAVLDIIMPDLNGFELLTAIRNHHQTQSLPVVLLSSLGKVSDKVRGIRDGASDYLVKPCEPEELIARVERLIERRYRETEDLQGHLSAYSIEELCQGFEQYAKTGHLGVVSGNRSGTLEISEGLMVSARLGELEDELALEGMLSLRDGVFHFQNKDSISPREHGGKNKILSSLLMNAAWIQDELHIRKKLLPEAEVRLRLAIDEPPIADKLPDLPFDEIRKALGSGKGVTLARLLEDINSAPNRIRLALALMIEQELVTPDAREPRQAGNFRSFFSNLIDRVEGNIHLYVLIDSACKEMLPVLLGSANLEIDAREQGLLANRSGLLHLIANDRKILVLFETIEQNGYPEQHKQFSFEGCVMMLAHRIPRPKLYRLIADFKALVGRTANLLVIPANEQVGRDLAEVAPETIQDGTQPQK